MTALFVDQPSNETLVSFSALSLRNFAHPAPAKKMTRLRVEQIYKSFHGSATMGILGYKDADRMGEWVNVNGIELVATDAEMVSEVVR